MFNSAVCCTESSFLLLLHQVEAFIGKKNTLLFTINHRPPFFFLIAVFTPTTSILEQNTLPRSLLNSYLNCANNFSKSSGKPVGTQKLRGRRRQRTRAGQGWWGILLFQAAQPASWRRNHTSGSGWEPPFRIRRWKPVTGEVDGHGEGRQGKNEVKTGMVGGVRSVRV